MSISSQLIGGGFLYEKLKRFHIKIPITTVNGRSNGIVEIMVIARTAKQARAFARKEMLKIARISTNRAEVVDMDPGGTDE